jgi:hypothetical protein
MSGVQSLPGFIGTTLARRYRADHVIDITVGHLLAESEIPAENIPIMINADYHDSSLSVGHTSPDAMSSRVMALQPRATSSTEDS